MITKKFIKLILFLEINNSFNVYSHSTNMRTKFVTHVQIPDNKNIKHIHNLKILTLKIQPTILLIPTMKHNIEINKFFRVLQTSQQLQTLMKVPKSLCHFKNDSTCFQDCFSYQDVQDTSSENKLFYLTYIELCRCFDSR